MAFDLGAVVAHIKADVSQFQQGLNQAQSKLNSFSSGVKKVDDSLAGFRTSALVVGGAVAAGLGVAAKQALEMAGNFEQSEIAFTTLLKDRQKAVAAIKEIEKDAKSTPYNLPDLIKANQLLISAGVSTSDARDQIKDLGNAIAATGGGTAELNRLSANLQQIKAVGKASALDIKQFAFAGINIYQLLADATGKNVAEVKEMDISYELLTEALGKASEEGGMFAGAMEAQSSSLQGRISNLQDVIGLTLKDIAVNSGFFTVFSNGVAAITSKLEAAGPAITRFFTVLGNIMSYIVGIFQGQDLSAELEEAFSFFFGDKAGQVTAFVLGFIGILQTIGQWIADNQELVITFLKGLGIALTALLVVSMVTAALSALLNPITWVILGITLLYTAWETNFLGIRNIVEIVVNAIVAFFNEVLMPMFNAFVEWFTQRWDFIKLMIQGAWEIIKGIIQVAWAAVYAILAVGIALLTGDWQKAWDRIKNALSIAWDGIKSIFNGIVNFIKGWGGTVFNSLVEPFERAWNKIKEFVEKIKDNLDFTKRHSPSVVDIVRGGVDKVNRAMAGLEFSTNLAPNVAGLAVTNGGQNQMINDIHVSMPGAIIGDQASADRLAERIGDNIIRKVQRNVRF